MRRTLRATEYRRMARVPRYWRWMFVVATIALVGVVAVGIATTLDNDRLTNRNLGRVLGLRDGYPIVDTWVTCVTKAGTTDRGRSYNRRCTAFRHDIGGVLCAPGTAGWRYAIFVRCPSAPSRTRSSGKPLSDTSFVRQWPRFTRREPDEWLVYVTSLKLHGEEADISQTEARSAVQAITDTRA